MLENENADNNNVVKPPADPTVEDDETVIAGNDDTEYDGNRREIMEKID